MANQPPTCLYCEQDEQSIPLLPLQFQGKQYWICPQHLPILIHRPSQLADKLPGIQSEDSLGEPA